MARTKNKKWKSALHDGMSSRTNPSLVFPFSFFEKNRPSELLMPRFFGCLWRESWLLFVLLRGLGVLCELSSDILKEKSFMMYLVNSQVAVHVYTHKQLLVTNNALTLNTIQYRQELLHENTYAWFDVVIWACQVFVISMRWDRRLNINASRL